METEILKTILNEIVLQNLSDETLMKIGNLISFDIENLERLMKEETKNV